MRTPTLWFGHVQDVGPLTVPTDRRTRLHAQHLLPPRGRITKTASGFTLKISPKNLGAMLRRQLDYAFPNQRAEVFVKDARAKNSEWKPAGVWYLAGSNTCVYSNPKDELGETEHIVQTSNRRFRDDKFLISRKLTKGKRAIRVRLRFTPVQTPLFPGRPLGETCVERNALYPYSFAMPKFDGR